MRIAVIGSGYVGLVTGGCLASIGHEVVCTDSDEAKIDLLRKGKLPIFEPGLDTVVARAMHEGQLAFTVDVAAAVEASDVIFICVGTPPMENGDADLSAIDQVARLIGTVARSPKLVIEKSTVPAQTGQKLKQALRVYSRNAGPLLRVASNPEFLREGTAVEDFLHPERIVVGVDNESTAADLKEIYRPIIEQQFDCPLHDGRCHKTAMPEWLVTTIKRGVDQARVEQFFGAQDLLCQRSRRVVRKARRKRGRSYASRRAGPAHRSPLSQGWTRLWWFLSAEGCAGIPSDGRAGGRGLRLAT